MTAPTPIKLRLLRGNPGRRPIPREPQPKSAAKCPEPPDYVTGYAAREWKWLAPELWALGLLTVLDQTVFAAYCVSYGRWRAAEELLQGEPLVVPGSEGNQVQNPLVRIASQAARDLLRVGSEFGLTPSARARVAAGMPPASPSSKFGDLLS
jgi:P27 family predicted phage terminase small subunit